MHIREANQNDIPGILSVLKASLGETSSKKTEEVWKYKHLDNPFGESLVLIAETAGMIIGVRAFMRWKWKMSGKEYSAFRAVDTATHPSHQGKGIFKKLTLKALEIGKQNGDQFVFNTPNRQSKPGYLKMGWKEVGKIKTTLIPVNPIYWSRKKDLNFFGSMVNEISPELLQEWNTKLEANNVIYTPKTSNYLSWRYCHNPLQEYMLEIDENVFLAGYLKHHSNLKELRLSELIMSSKANKKFVKKKIRDWAKDSGAHFISLSSSINQGLFRKRITAEVGPVLTYIPINNSHQEFYNLSSWDYSLGDLELF